MLYSLSLFNERQEGFFIGLFASKEEARQMAEHYLSAVPGFRDYPCTWEITEKTVIGTIGLSRKVHMIWGWDEGADGNETGIWSSHCYADVAAARRALISFYLIPIQKPLIYKAFCLSLNFVYALFTPFFHIRLA